jgi:predicted RNA binding protein YcfA (HicA-like mRNA interferase family)
MKVRDVIRRLTDDGWVQVAQKGSHRQFKHPTKPGKVTVPGKPSDDLAEGTSEHPAPGRSPGVKS